MITTLYRLILTCFLVGGGVTYPAIPAHVMRATAPPPDSGQITILVLDMSGSMKNNDAPEIRCSAAKVYIDLSKEQDQIGIIGLTNIDGQTDTQGFTSASVWQRPLTLSGERQRQALKDVISQRPSNTPTCEHPSGSTPIYDALFKAFHLLDTATQHSSLQDSVILMSDGEPDPDAEGQMNKVRNELMPDFLKRRWPVETLALGGQQDYLNFLQDLAHQTGGSFYDDTQGNVSGVVSPLNINDFFIRILAKREQLTVTMPTDTQTLNGTTWLKDITPEEHTSHLDIVVAKTENITATLTTPEGTTLPLSPGGQGIVVISDNPYYEIFSIDTPRLAPYQIQVNGVGQFLIHTLAASDLKLSITPSSASVLLLNQLLTVKAHIVDNSNNQNEAISGNRFAVKAMLHYEGKPMQGTKAISQRTDLHDRDGSGNYQATFQLPSNASPGLYEIVVEVSGNTGASIAEARTAVRLVHAPRVKLLVPHMADALQIQQTQWSWPFPMIYNPDQPFKRWLGQPALQQQSVYPQVLVSGTIQVDTNSLSHLEITDVTLDRGKDDIEHLHASNHNGRFSFELPRLTDGVYKLTCTMSGSFEDTLIQPASTTYILHLINVPPPQDALQRAWLITSFYLLLLLFVFWLCWRLSRPAPFGEALLLKGNNTYHYPFKKAQRNPFIALFRRNSVYSEMVPIADADGVERILQTLPYGLSIRFYHNGKIKVRRRRDHKAAMYWKYKEAQQVNDLHFRLREVRELVYQSEDEARGALPPLQYLIDAGKPKKQ